MKIPSKLKIAGIDFTVGTKPISDPDNHGGLDIRKNYIYINPDACSVQRKLSLLHEVLHIFCVYTGAIHVLQIDDTREEALVRMFEPFLYSFIKDNPKLIKAIMES